MHTATSWQLKNAIKYLKGQTAHHHEASLSPALECVLLTQPLANAWHSPQPPQHTNIHARTHRAAGGSIVVIETLSLDK